MNPARGQASPITALVVFLIFAVLFSAGFSIWRAMAVRGVVGGAAQYAITSMEAQGCYTQALDQGIRQYLDANGVNADYVGVTASTGDQPVQYGYPMTVTVKATVSLWVVGNASLWRINVQASDSGTSGYLSSNGGPAPDCAQPQFTDQSSPTGGYAPVFGGGANGG